jgi:nitrous oxide reductase accessory protein NosL
VKKIMLAIAIIYFIGVSKEMAFAEKKERPKCPVCGMYADMDTLWVTEIELKDGTKYQFESPVHAFSFYLQPEKFTDGKVKRSQITHFKVREWFTGELMEAESLHFLAHSQMKGPMGMDLVPIKDEAKGKELEKKYKGRLIHFGDISKEFIKRYEKIRMKEMRKM